VAVAFTHNGLRTDLEIEEFDACKHLLDPMKDSFGDKLTFLSWQNAVEAETWQPLLKKGVTRFRAAGD
jgi:hypothetical protein